MKTGHGLNSHKHDSIVLSMFQASTSIELGDGSRSFFWTDKWLHGQSVMAL